MEETKNQEQEEQKSGCKSTGEDVTLRNHVLGAMGVGMVPIPVVDLVSLAAIQLNLLRKIAKKYDIEFTEDIAKNVLASLIGSSIPVAFSFTFASLIKGVPIIGQTAAALAMPILSGATTYAVGKVFTQHFASGGTFLTFDPDKVKDYYAEMFKEGKDIASSLKKENKKAE